MLALRARIDNSFEAYFVRGDPWYEAYLEFHHEFGSDEMAYILYEAPDRPHGVWDLDVMRKIDRIGREIEADVPFVKQVTTLANVELLSPVPDGILVSSIDEDLPETQDGMLTFERRMLAKPIYVGGLTSADGRYGAIVIEMARSSVDPPEVIRLDPTRGNDVDNLYPQPSYAAIEAILAKPDYAGIVFHHTGDVALNSVMNKITARESKNLGIVCFVIVGGLLFMLMRTPVGVYGPLAVVLMAVLATVAFIGTLGWNLDQMFGMMPTLLIAVGVADSVHVISEFQVFLAKMGDRREAIRRTMYLVGTPCLLTSLTTAAGFAAMGIAPIKAIARFGAYSAFGVIAAFFLTTTLLVVLLSFQRGAGAGETGERATRRARGGRIFQRILALIARFDVRHRRGILAVVSVLFVVSAFGIVRLRVESNFLEEFGDSLPVRKATLFVDRAMGGAMSFSYLIDAREPEGVKDPAVLREIERLQLEAERHADVVRKSYSIVDFLKDINQTFHEGDPAYYRIPESRELVAQYMLLYEMSGGEDANDYVSQDYSRTRLELRTSIVDSGHINAFLASMDRYLEQNPVTASTVRLTGIGALWHKLTEYITTSQIRGFGLAFAAITVMMCVLFRSIKLGLLSMASNLLPVMLTLGGMGWTGVPLDYVRLLIAPIAIGIAVDESIHHVTRLRHEFLRTGDYAEALAASMVDCGRALTITSGVLVAGFSVFILSAMASMAAFGLLLSSTIVLALAADFFLMPALMLTFKPFGPEGCDSRSKAHEGQPIAA